MGKDRGLTDDIVNCSAGGVTDQNQVSLFHLCPVLVKDQKTPVDLEAVKTHLKTVLLPPYLSGDLPRANGLITGGINYSLKQLGQTSRRLYDCLSELIRQKVGQSRVSILWGRKDESQHGKSELAYDTKTDTWYLSIQRDDLDDVQTLKDLKDTLSVLRIAETDTLTLPNGSSIKGPVNLHA